ncbi:hypothetical protein G6F63_016097 [Rhizopus arrhizus]|nr:hypothetical protein G6F63_016097 [Rhizopus arrhizus]
MATDLALAIHIGMAAAVRRPQVHAQPQFARRVGGRQEFVASLAPDAIEQRRDGQRGGDAVADQLREGIALLEGQFGGGVHLAGELSKPRMVVSRSDSAARSTKPGPIIARP